MAHAAACWFVEWCGQLRKHATTLARWSVMSKHDTIDFLINVALNNALLVGGCAAIILVIAVANGILNLVGRI
jgi:hypothetical protein